MLTRMFFPIVDDTTRESTITKEIEFDIEVLLGMIGIEHKYMLTPVSDKPGCVRMQLHKSIYYDFLTKISNIFVPGEKWIFVHWLKGVKTKTFSVSDAEKEIGFKIVNNDRFVLSHFAKCLYRKKNASVSNPPYEKDISVLVAAAINVAPDKVSVELVGNAITKASVETVYSVFIEGNMHLHLAVDHVGCIKLQCWPMVAEDWVKRERKWPESEIIMELSSFCYIIAKPSPEEKENTETTEWCYSFAHHEKQLVNLRSEEQNLIYLIIKAIFYKNAKPLNPENITSFLLKTVMFWVCEEHPPNDSLWEINFPSIIDAIHYVFKRLKKL